MTLETVRTPCLTMPDHELTLLHQPIGIRKELRDKFQKCAENLAAGQHGPKISLRTMCKLLAIMKDSG